MKRCLLLLPLLLPGCQDSGSGSGPTPAPPSLTLTGPGSTAYPEAAETHAFTLRLPGLATITGELAVSFDPTKSPYKATVLVAKGGGGIGYWKGGPITTHILLGLLDRGFRVVDLGWDRGWWQDGGVGGTSFLRQAERYARIVQWVKQRYPGEKLLTYGNSGAGAAVMYALCHYGAQQYLHGCLVHNGPPFTRVDYEGGLAAFPQCELGNYPPNITFECGTPLCAEPSAYAPYLNGVDAATARSWSILNGNENNHITATEIRIQQGLKDCGTFSATAGWTFYSTMMAGGSRITIEYIPGMTHDVSLSVGDEFTELIWNTLEELAGSPDPPASPAGAWAGVWIADGPSQNAGTWSVLLVHDGSSDFTGIAHGGPCGPGSQLLRGTIDRDGIALDGYVIAGDGRETVLLDYDGEALPSADELSGTYACVGTGATGTWRLVRDE